jgi:thioredoxin 1
MSYIEITQTNFEELVLKAEKTVLLDFWAPWCGPCRMVAPIVEEIAQEREDILVGKVNVDEEMPLAVQFGITSIPTLLVMKGGQVAAKAIGYRPKADILPLLDA